MNDDRVVSNWVLVLELHKWIVGIHCQGGRREGKGRGD